MSVVNNQQTNYSLYYNALDYFKTIMVNHPSIEQVSVGDSFQVDDIEFPYYPLGNILITQAQFDGSKTVYTCQLTIADKIKLKNNESTGTENLQNVPFYGTDDTVDIHANTLSIVNDLISYTQYSVQSFDIDTIISSVAFKEEFPNGLAGWVATFDLIAHNDRNRCLFDLYPYSTGSQTVSVYSQVVSFSPNPMNSIVYRCDGNFVTASYGQNETTLPNLVNMFNAVPPVQAYASFLEYGTYYDNGDGRVRCEMPTSVYSSLCSSGSLTLDVIYD
jgi:hypothetical protein